MSRQKQIMKKSRQESINKSCLQINMEEEVMITDDRAIFSIGVASKMLNISPRTLRSYEEQGFLRPIRKGNRRYFSMDNIKWIGCVRDMVHEHGISVPAIHRLLSYTPCWNIARCSFEKRKECTAFMSSALVPKKIERPSPSQQQDRITPIQA